MFPLYLLKTINWVNTLEFNPDTVIIADLELGRALQYGEACGWLKCARPQAWSPVQDEVKLAFLNLELFGEPNTRPLCGRPGHTNVLNQFFFHQKMEKLKIEHEESGFSDVLSELIERVPVIVIDD